MWAVKIYIFIFQPRRVYMNQIKVIFVCMGNICRSPTAEGVFRQLVKTERTADRFEIDSAGTIAYHEGEPSDHRASEAALRRGVDLSTIRARKVVMHDYEHFDYVLAMDSENYRNLMAECPAEYQHKVQLFLDYAQQHNETDVPDPYYGGAQGFEKVLDLIEDAAQGFHAKALN